MQLQFSAQIELYLLVEMSSGTLFRVALFGTDVSENVSSTSTGVVRLIGFHGCLTVETYPLKMETILSPKRRFELVLHDTKLQKTSLIDPS
jgi:hypothetical protein